MAKRNPLHSAANASAEINDDTSACHILPCTITTRYQVSFWTYATAVHNMAWYE